MKIKQICSTGILALFTLCEISWGMIQEKKASSDIIKSSNIADIKKHVNKKSLVIFDLDNTVFLSIKEDVLWDQKLVLLIKYIVEKFPTNKKNVIKACIKLGSNAQIVIDVKPVEDSVIDIIQDLQKQGIAVMSVTARPQEDMKRTFEQLEFEQCTNLGNDRKIDFSVTAPQSSIKKIQKMNQPADEAVYYEKGILFCSYNDKGCALKEILKDGGCYEKIIIIDDKEKNVLDMQKCAQELDIDFVGIRYAFLDEKVKNCVLDDFTKQVVLDYVNELLNTNNVVPQN